MPQHRRVILLVEATSAYGRGCLHGIARYARTQGGWSFFLEPRFPAMSLQLASLKKWKADGVIARVENQAIAQVIRALKLPTVDIRGAIRIPGVPGVYTDHHKVVAMAGEHLISNGLKHLAFCGFPGVDFSEIRQRIFAGFSFPHGEKHVFSPSQDQYSPQQTYEQRGAADAKALQGWIKSLPKPVGIIACNDTRGWQLLEACANIGARVPYEVAVVGVDDDDVLCELAHPTLTSVSPNVETIGFDAAAMLERMLSGKKPPADPILVAPIALELRGSSDMMALNNPILIEAVRLIRSKAAEGLNVDDLIKELYVSRSTLERQFHDQLNVTPYAYILRCRIDRVKQLLLDTRYNLAEISRMSGFRSVAHMVAVFRARIGQTPAQYRRGNN